MEHKTRLRLPYFYKKYSKDLKALSEAELKAKLKPNDNDIFRLLIFSDLHGWLHDPHAFNCLKKVISNNKFDEIVSNGDAIDLPFLSGHTSKLKRINDSSDLLRDYSEVKEMEWVRRAFKDLAKITRTKIRYRNGNHEERITSPKKYNKEQLERLNELFIAYESSRLDVMLNLHKNGIIYDPTPYHTYFNCFTVVHGLSLAQNAPDKNLQSFWGSGSSGHTHRLNIKYYTKLGKILCWAESGCLRLREMVEYFPTAVVPNWQHGFIVVTFYKVKQDTYLYFLNSYPIHDGKTVFDGVVY